MTDVGKTILVVDDSPLQTIILRNILIGIGFRITTAKDGIEALEHLKKAQFDLVISDISMPRMDGYQLCRFIKEAEEFSHIPVILCTSLSSPHDLMQGLEVGADNYIVRPYNPDILLPIIHVLLATPLMREKEITKEEVVFCDKKYVIGASRQHILDFLLSTYQNVQQQNQELLRLRQEIEKAYAQLKGIQKEQERLLLNIFPESVAQELQAYGSVTPTRYEAATVMFIDFIGFTKYSKTMPPADLVQMLGFYFENFDAIIERHKLERIKTVGDGYMCAGGLPVSNQTHASDCILAALEIHRFMRSVEQEVEQKYHARWSIRMGINTGPLVAGVVGKKRFAYDIWGDTVNVASRLESNCEKDRINVGATTRELTKGFFKFEPRGSIPVRNKEGLEQMLEMYYVLPNEPNERTT